MNVSSYFVTVKCDVTHKKWYGKKVESILQYFIVKCIDVCQISHAIMIYYSGKSEGGRVINISKIDEHEYRNAGERGYPKIERF